VQTKNTPQVLTYVFLFIIDPNLEKNGLKILHLSNEEPFLMPQKMLRYMGGHPAPFTSSKEAFLPNESVPSSVLLGPNPEETRNTTHKIFGDPSYAIKVMVKIESEGEEQSYVPSTGSKTLLSSCTYEDEDTTVLTNQAREILKRQSQAQKRLLSMTMKQSCCFRTRRIMA
jgi:hypothetical protein